uniref:Uncharacterized protein n=1 Tax=Lepeophtheirus salmonis TaxID=72036 RepID=A0A0K2VFV8_LEPSM
MVKTVCEQGKKWKSILAKISHILFNMMAKIWFLNSMTKNYLKTSSNLEKLMFKL